ncbi:MAG: glutathione S-transferase family protein [Pseudomonadota bacterium]
MGLLIDGEWTNQWYDTKTTGGAFKRSEAKFRNWITADGSPGLSGDGGFKAETDRYHLYVSYACPWAHRTLIFRNLKGLKEHISVDVVHPDMLNMGWTFKLDGYANGDRLFQRDFLHQIYTLADKKMTGRVTVPILWDKDRSKIVSNESSEIIRMFNSAFDDITGNKDDYWPKAMRDEIEFVNARIYNTINNGVYKCGFATTQEAYDAAVYPIFESLDWVEETLSRNRYLLGHQITEADWRLFTTIVRFDAVYHQHFKCNRARIIDYPNLWGWAKELYQWPGISETVVFDHIIRHYHYSHETINPNRIVPINPVINWDGPHRRAF